MKWESKKHHTVTLYSRVLLVTQFTYIQTIQLIYEVDSDDSQKEEMKTQSSWYDMRFEYSRNFLPFDSIKTVDQETMTRTTSLESNVLTNTILPANPRKNYSCSHSNTIFHNPSYSSTNWRSCFITYPNTLKNRPSC